MRLLFSPLVKDKLFGLPLGILQEEVSKTPQSVKVDVQVSNGQSQSHSETGPMSMKKGSRKPSGYRKRSPTKNVSSTTGKKAKVVQGKKYSKGWSTPSVSTTSRGRGVFSNSFSSYSSGRQISPLSKSVATDHFRQVGSFSTAGGGGGLEFQFHSRLPLSSVPLNMSVTRDPNGNLLLQEEAHTNLQEGAVELVNPPLTPSFYSRLFLVPKINEKMRPVIDFSVLNRHLIVPYFKMETNRSIRGSIRFGMWTTSLDLTDTYFHIPISPKFRKFLRFVWEDRVYAFKVMPFGLSTAPLVFTRVFQAIVAHLHSQSILIHSYLDDSLLKKYAPISSER
jgi:hypothetical protein